MWRYQQSGFAFFLLGELQKQQQGSIFCDTLLQTEGVCVPAHSCVLAALSPIFSRILSTCPAPPPGKNRLLRLDAVRPHALLKLVGFLYSGEMEIESQSEHEDVMAAAHKLGLKNLIEKKRVWVGRRVEDVGRCGKEAGVQTHESVKGKESVSVPLPLDRRSGTSYNANNAPGTSVLEADLSFDRSSSSKGLSWVSDVTVPPHTNVTEVPASNQCKIKAKRWKMRDGRKRNQSWQQSQVKVLNVQGGKLDQPGVMESRNVSGKDFRKLLEAVSLPKNARSEQKLDKLKVKIKLRRRGASWESNLLVSVQGESKSDEVKECGPQTRRCPSIVCAGQSLGTLTPPTDLPISPPDCSTHVSLDKPCPHTPNDSSMSSILDLPALSSSPPRANESDEDIATLLEDMFMMGLNILPLMPLDKNLDEQELQLDPLEEEKGPCPYVQGCEEEVKETTLLTPLRSPQQRYEEFKEASFPHQTKPETVKPFAQSAEDLHGSLSNMKKDTNLKTMKMDLVSPLEEDLMLTTGITAFPHCPTSETGQMSDLEMTPIPQDMVDFKLLKCLSPLESDVYLGSTLEASVQSKCEISVTPSQEPNSQNQAPPSETTTILGFPLALVINSSSPHLCPESNCSQDQSCLDKQKLRTHNDMNNENGISKDQADYVGEFPKQRITRRRLENLSSDSGALSRQSKTHCADRVKECKCANFKPTTINTCGASTRISRPVDSNRKTIAGVKRKQEHEDFFPKVQVTAGPVKRGCERPPKSKEDATKCLQKCNKAKTIAQAPNHCSTATNLFSEDCKVKTTKIANEQDNKESNKQTNLDETKITEADVNGNNEQTNQSAHIKYSGHARTSSIIDQIFHQTSYARKSSLLIGQKVFLNSQDSTCAAQRIQGPLEKSGENSKSIYGGNKDFTKDVMDVDLAVLHKEMDSRAKNNVPEVMERIGMASMVKKMQTSVCINSDGTPAEHLENKKETAVSKENLRRCEVVQLTKETIKDKGNEVRRCAPCPLDVDRKDRDDIDVEEEQYSFENILKDDLSMGQTSQTSCDTSNAAVTQRGQQVQSNGPSVQIDDVLNRLQSHNLRKNYEDISAVQTTLDNSVSKQDHSEDEAIEVDVLGDYTDSPSRLLAARQNISLPIESLQEEEFEMDMTEEEEVDITGEETD